MKIPLHRPYIDDDELNSVKEVLDSGWLTKGPKAKEFEKRCSEYLGVKYAIAVTSCTTALHLALIGVGVGQGDEVIVADYTFPATGHAVMYCNATPIFVDVSPLTYNMDPMLIEKHITSRTKAIIPVHTFGQPADMDKIMDVAKQYNLKVIEDAACAFGSGYKGDKVGSFGDVGCFSFHVTKGICTGEGGLVVTNNKELADKMRTLSVFGSVSSWDAENSEQFVMPSFEMLGYNYKMSDVAAAIGLAQLDKLDRITQRRTELARYWDKKLKDMELISAPYIRSDISHNYQGYTTLVDKNVDRNKVIDGMREQGIQLQIGTYSSCIQPIYKSKSYCPVSFDIYNRALRLPLYYEMEESQIDFVSSKLDETLKRCLYVS